MQRPNAAATPAPRTTIEGTLVVENEKGRAALLERAERNLPEGMCLVKVVDIVGARRAVRTAPKDPRAKLVAREVPVVLRGGLTSLVTYYVVPNDGLDAVESHYHNDELSHTYEVLLNVARLGTRVETPRAVPA